MTSPVEAATRSTPADRRALAALILLYLIVIIRTAWLSDDAYITFRTVDNFVGGYGLTWNVAERVQTFTNPLWMLVVSGLYFFTHEISYTVLILSIAVSAAAVILIGSQAARSTGAAVIGIGVLTLSRAFIDYSTSGLENPLSHLLLAIFLIVYYRNPAPDLTTLLKLAAVAGLATLNRMDTLLVYIPMLGLTLVRLRSWRAAGALAAGFAPFAMWEVFSIIYYGFPFPNTAYAKLNNGLDTITLIGQGLHYLQESLAADPLTLTTITAGVTAATVSAIRSRSWQAAAVAVGILLYLGYIVKVGGDFMSGRFLALPLMAAVMVIMNIERATPGHWAVALPVIVAVGFLSPRPTLASGPDYGTDPAEGLFGNNTTEGRWGIADERAFYYQCAGLASETAANPSAPYPNCLTVSDGRLARLSGIKTFLFEGIGFFGFYAGPEVHVVDALGLGDPLLARLLPERRSDWRIGHFERKVPENYFETVETRHNNFLDVRLKLYYDRLTLVTRGDIFDPQRWVEIWKFNTGQYGYLLEEYNVHAGQ